MSPSISIKYAITSNARSILSAVERAGISEISGGICLFSALRLSRLQRFCRGKAWRVPQPRRNNISKRRPLADVAIDDRDFAVFLTVFNNACGLDRERFDVAIDSRDAVYQYLE
jgi:hypothetical protein